MLLRTESQFSQLRIVRDKQRVRFNTVNYTKSLKLEN